MYYFPPLGWSSPFLYHLSPLLVLAQIENQEIWPWALSSLTSDGTVEGRNMLVEVERLPRLWEVFSKCSSSQCENIVPALGWTKWWKYICRTTDWNINLPPVAWLTLQHVICGSIHLHPSLTSSALKVSKREEMSTHFLTSVSSPKEEPWLIWVVRWGEARPYLGPVSEVLYWERCPPRLPPINGTPWTLPYHDSVQLCGYMCLRRMHKLTQAHCGSNSKLAQSGLSVRGYLHLIPVLISWFV